MAFSSEWVLAGEAVVDMVVDAAQHCFVVAHI
jgi:hypothetical protein